MRHIRAAAFDLGDEPPLGVDGDAEEPISRRRISIRWLMATLLTGICGAALMGGAVYAALDGEYRFAQSPETVRSALRGALAAGERPSNVARKGDRMSILSESFSAKQTLRLATASKDGDREVIKVRAVTKVAANLAQSVTSASVDVPRFNPAKLIADSSDDDAAPQTEATGELTLVMRDIAALPPSTKFAAELPMEDVLMKVRETAEFSMPSDRRAPALANLGGPLAFAPAGAADPANVLAQPENISSVDKSGEEATGGNDWLERAVVAKKGDTVASILMDLGVPEVSARAASAAFSGRALQGALPEGLRLKVLLDASSGAVVPLRVAAFNDEGHQGTVALSDLGRFLPVQEPADTQVADITPNNGDDDEEGGGRAGITLYDSVWETALRHEVPRPVIESMIRVYSFDVDFQRRVRAGDSFEVVYEPDEAGGAGGVLYAGLTVGGEERRYYRYQTPDDGLVDFYDEAGKSAKKFLVRKPLSGGILRSGFGMRRHPILGYSRLHSGVDWADRVGTPIYAAGNGTIKKAAWTSGYGRRIEIQHANGYVTTYSHQSGFAKGIREGLRVRQGQLIGYIGSTGLSTGAHLHYEVLVNGRFVDPMRIRLPRGRALDGKILASFEDERERIDTLLNHTDLPKVASGGARALDDAN